MRAHRVDIFALLLTLSALLTGVAWAQGWSVQTVALRDLRQARTVVGELQALGFDAFPEFAMHDGEQFVRVRVGCYTDRSAAEAAAQALAGHVTKQAVAVTLSATTRADECVREDVGFLKPRVWKQLDPADGLPTFDVDIGGHKARLLFTGQGWRVLQSGEAFTPTPAAANASFVVARPGGAPWVAQELASGTRMLCPGKLIGTAGSAAVVERSNEVVACMLVPVSSEQAKGSTP
ncbi:MAG: SPOR domain-containing protein [Deinococcales bacterium]